MFLLGDFGTYVFGDEAVLPVNDLVQKCRADRVDVVCGEDPGVQEVDLIVGA